MKYLISILTLLLMLTSLLTAQQNNFKTVYIAKDVVDNYITASGGLEKISKINNVMIEGQIVISGIESNIVRYTGRDFYFQILHSNDFTEITAYNDKTNSGWDINDDHVIDFGKQELEYYKLHSVNFWGTYIDGYDLGIKCEFNEFENNDTSLYCVNFVKDGYIIETAYFDKHDFKKVKNEINGQEKFFSDYRRVGQCGILMPFLIMANDTLKVTNYQFNQLFNKRLLSKEGLEYYKP